MARAPNIYIILKRARKYLKIQKQPNNFGWWLPSGGGLLCADYPAFNWF
jgi:hypothetical protein